MIAVYNASRRNDTHDMSKPTYIIKPDGTVETDDPEAVFEVLRRLRGLDGEKTARKQRDSAPEGALPERELRPVDPRVVRLLKRVAHDQSISSSALAESLHLKGGRALGPFTRRVRAELEAVSFKIEQVVSVGRDENGQTFWTARSKLAEAIEALEKRGT